MKMNIKKTIKFSGIFLATAVFLLILLFSFREEIECPNPESLTIYPEESVVVERVNEDSLLTHWNIKYSTVKIYGSINADQLENQENFIVEINNPSINKYFITEFDNNFRYYFLFVFSNTNNEVKKIEVSERILPLSGVFNFRDLGGYPTKDGKSIKWGVLYRSSSLSDATTDDEKYLSKINLKTIIDLRTIDEIQSEPDIVPNGINYYHLPIYSSKEKPLGLNILLPGADIEKNGKIFIKLC